MQNPQNPICKTCGSQPLAAGKPPVGRLSTTKQKGFVGFCKFCDKKQENETIRDKPTLE